jgi:sialate O-acetylesterase
MSNLPTPACRTFLSLLAAVIGAAAAGAMDEMKPCSLFSDGAVLQQDLPVPVWGTATNGEIVTVTFRGQALSAVAQDGRWMVRLKPMKAGGPWPMIISGSKARFELKDILVGEVWICSGQSNMQFPLIQCSNAAPAIASSQDPMMRLFNVPLKPLPPGLVGPIPEMTTRWTECKPATVTNFSGVGYFFGRKLRETLKVPVGLINISYGGSYVGLWMSSATLRELAGSGTYRNGWLYDTMLRPLQPYAMRGVIWYQGESDADHSLSYRKAFPAMIDNWRQDWQQGLFPFLFVQLTAFNFYNNEVPTEPQEQTTWAELREVQAQTATVVSNTAMVVTTDLGSTWNVHPVRKEEVGNRLAMAAAATVYGKPVNYKSPAFKELTLEGSRATVTFGDTAGGLVKQGPAVTGFTIAGEDRKFHTANAVLDGDKVMVSSPNVPKPVAVRYGWANYPLMNLFGADGLPAAPFRTDDFPLIKCSKCKSMSGRGISNGICNECGGTPQEYRLL